MRFREGLLYIYKNRQADGEITDPFYLYCRLSDLCAYEYADKEKVELFYAIDRRLCVFETLMKQGENGGKELLNSYMVVSDLLSEASFQKLVECAVWVMSPGAKLPEQPAQKTCSPPAAQLRAQKVMPVKVERAEESEKVETRTPLNSASSYGAVDDVDIFIGAGAILLLLSLLVGVFGLLAGCFHWKVSWVVWQWIIGIIGGGWLTFWVCFLVYILDDSITCDYFVAGFIALLICALLNFIFLLIFREGYKVLYACLSGWELIGGLSLTCACYSDLEDEWGGANLGVTVGVLIFTILGLIFV